ncbi:alpha/beta hydrolase family protein [Clostridium boliviensis]|uniref:Alpha/beta hydrolase family protein n=1 Tax=Clostridium boliviensis TaxID=318465 RepID=A0ABU4GLG7_9CLOT|nr:alpha/beta hydrolase family protein [Clostridium boliviensis]MDW2798461.1 alpha/beta hydrolase family protein [Clostridium boliviensis]
MAQIQVNYFSGSLMKVTTVQVILPNDLLPIMVEGNEHYKRETKTLYLLHGFSGGAMDWLSGSQVQEMAIRYNLAIVMPSGDNSFYLDAKGTGRAYGRFVGEELVNYIARTFRLSNKKEDIYIGGLSMGGFGAIHTGFKYNNTFAKVFALSSALIINNIKNKEPGFQDAIADYDYYNSIFGDLKLLEDSENNPEFLVKKILKEGKQLPPLFMACGTEDFLLQENRSFIEFLAKEKVGVAYQESTGTHDWKFWNEYLEPAIKWLLN